MTVNAKANWEKNLSRLMPPGTEPAREGVKQRYNQRKKRTTSSLNKKSEPTNLQSTKIITKAIIQRSQPGHVGGGYTRLISPNSSVNPAIK